MPGAAAASWVERLARLRIFESLSIPGYRWFMFSIMARGLAFQGQQVARGWLAYELTGSPLAVGIAVASWGLPMLLFSLLGGVAADRMSRRHIIIGTEGISAVLAVAMGLLITTGHIAFWHVVVSGLASGTAISMNMPSRQAFIFDLVGPRRIANAVALNAGAMNSMRVIGPVLLGVIIGAAGIDWAYYLIAAALVASLVVVAWRTQEPPPQPPVTSSPARDLSQGLGYVWGHRMVFWLLFMALALMFVGLSFRNLMPAFAVEVLSLGPEGYGLLLAMVGVGALVGSVLIAALGNSVRRGLLLMIAAVGWGASLFAFSLSTDMATAIPLLLVLGLTSTGFMTLSQIILQTTVSNEVRGRVLSFFLLTVSLNSVGTVPIGALAEVIGTGQALKWSGVAVLAFAILIGLWRRDLRRLR